MCACMVVNLKHVKIPRGPCIAQKGAKSKNYCYSKLSIHVISRVANTIIAIEYIAPKLRGKRKKKSIKIRSKKQKIEKAGQQRPKNKSRYKFRTL